MCALTGDGAAVSAGAAAVAPWPVDPCAADRAQPRTPPCIRSRMMTFLLIDGSGARQWCAWSASRQRFRRRPDRPSGRLRRDRGCGNGTSSCRGDRRSGRSSAAVESNGMLTVSFQAIGCTGWPLSSSTWKKKPCRCSGCDQDDLLVIVPDLRLAELRAQDRLGLRVEARTADLVLRRLVRRLDERELEVDRRGAGLLRSARCGAVDIWRRAVRRTRARPRSRSWPDRRTGIVPRPCRSRDRTAPNAASAASPACRCGITITSARSPGASTSVSSIDRVFLEPAVRADLPERSAPPRSRLK